MKDYKGYLIDLDGTMYRGEDPIPFAKEFIKWLQDEKKQFLFVTNNSTKKPEEVVQKLSSFGIHVTQEHVLTSAIATAKFVKTLSLHHGVDLIGEDGLFHAFKKEGILLNKDKPDAFIVGLDRTLTYEKLSQAVMAVQNGAKLISTNMDLKIPDGKHFIPGNGSIVKAIESATGEKAMTIGKPHSIMMKQALALLALSQEDVLMVGDNYDTDILFGIQNGVDTLHVQTGVTCKETLKGYKEQPTYTVNHLNDYFLTKKPLK